MPVPMPIFKIRYQTTRNTSPSLLFNSTEGKIFITKWSTCFYSIHRLNYEIQKPIFGKSALDPPKSGNTKRQSMNGDSFDRMQLEKIEVANHENGSRCVSSFIFWVTSASKVEMRSISRCCLCRTAAVVPEFLCHVTSGSELGVITALPYGTRFLLHVVNAHFGSFVSFSSPTSVCWHH